MIKEIRVEPEELSIMLGPAEAKICKPPWSSYFVSFNYPELLSLLIAI